MYHLLDHLLNKLSTDKFPAILDSFKPRLTVSGNLQNGCWHGHMSARGL